MICLEDICLGYISDEYVSVLTDLGQFSLVHDMSFQQIGSGILSFSQLFFSSYVFKYLSCSTVFGVLLEGLQLCIYRVFSAWFIYLSFSPQSFSTFHFYFTFLHLLTCILSTLAVFSSVYSRDCSFQFFYISVMILICSSFLLKSAN